MMEADVDALLAENRRRMAAVDRPAPYDPLRGTGCYAPEGAPRVRVVVPGAAGTAAEVPASMVDDPTYAAACGDRVAWERLRCRHDFEFWCARCVKIKAKNSSADVPFVLNGPQRRLLAVMEGQRTAGMPVRVILLKARQWGGSTLVQTYMAWIQTCRRRNWHSAICAHVKDTAATIRGMFTKLLTHYPAELWEGDEGKDAAPCFRPYERSNNVREIAGRGCRVTVGSCENQDAFRGADYSMAHLSETAFWPATPSCSPDDVMRSICGSIDLVPDTLIVVESTANGVGNYFHSEWLRCSSGKGDKAAVFVPWYEIAHYTLACPDARALATTLTAYERGLFDRHGCTLDQIYWYRMKNAGFSTRSQMMAEFPTTADEAFANAVDAVFDREHVERLRAGCAKAGVRGEVSLRGGGFFADAKGLCVRWEAPDADTSYIAAVDVGGRSDGADYSVIAVLTHEPHPRVVAQWRGHCDHDILAERAMAMARYYKNALLVIESNSFEHDEDGIVLLERLKDRYRNIYQRRLPDATGVQHTSRVGFHTNRATKAIIVCDLIQAVREGAYTERDPGACNEFLTYVKHANGSYAASAGNHDDILMTRAIALHVARTERPLPRIDAGSGCMLPSAYW